jgi:hypothetical protein
MNKVDSNSKTFVRGERVFLAEGPYTFRRGFSLRCGKT